MAGFIVGNPGFKKLGKALIKGTVKAVKKNPKTAAAIGGAAVVVAVATQVDYATLAKKFEKKADALAENIERKLDAMDNEEAV